jgi:hypothetical protein
VTGGEKPVPASCHALILFGLLLTVTSLDRIWRTYSDTVATGWDALGGKETLVLVLFVLVVAIVIVDALLPRSAGRWPADAMAGVLGLAVFVLLVAIVVAVNNESPDVFGDFDADDPPHGPAFAALGGVALMFVGWAGLIGVGRRTISS